MLKILFLLTLISDFSISFHFKNDESQIKVFNKNLFKSIDAVYQISSEVGHIFDGVGALSGGGATSRLLVNYAEPYRSEILDFLFKPKFGASLQIFKVEIGGDGQSTEGTEPSHMHHENEENYFRGYEWWLMKEAKKRNPDITLVALPWAWPGWIGGDSSFPYSNRTRTAEYIMKWVRGAKKYHNLDINFVGIWNERPYDVEYIKVLRATLDAANLSSVGIVAADGSQFITISQDIIMDSKLKDSISVVGAHYPGTFSGRVAQKTGKPLWSSEDYSTYNDVVGAGCLARILNQNYVNGNITATIVWNLIASYYDQLPFNRCSLMTANQPWSGHYELTEPLWVTAHTTQFTKPGWKYLTSSSLLEKGGSFVALTDGGDHLTIIIETITHDSSLCIRPPLPGYSVSHQKAVFQITNKNIGKLNMWKSVLGPKSAPDLMMQNLGQVEVDENGNIEIDLPINTLITLTTISDGNKGSFSQPPASQHFPLPYSDNFDSVKIFSEANDFADQSGSFEYFTNRSSDDGHKNTLRQVVTERPLTWCDDSDSPISVIGDFYWSSLNVSVSMKAESSDGVFIALRVNKGGCDTRQTKGIFFWLMKNSSWKITTDLNRSTFIKRCLPDWEKCSSVPYFIDNWNNVTLSISPQNRFYAYLNKHLVAEFDVDSKNDIPANGWVALGTANYGYGQFDNFKLTKF